MFNSSPANYYCATDAPLAAPNCSYNVLMQINYTNIYMLYLQDVLDVFITQLQVRCVDEVQNLVKYFTAQVFQLVRSLGV